MDDLDVPSGRADEAFRAGAIECFCDVSQLAVSYAVTGMHAFSGSPDIRLTRNTEDPLPCLLSAGNMPRALTQRMRSDEGAAYKDEINNNGGVCNTICTRRFRRCS